jgi:hypothetical protein
MKVDLLPLQRKDFASGPPSSDVSEAHYGLHMLWKMVQKDFELIFFEESF